MVSRGLIFLNMQQGDKSVPYTLNGIERVKHCRKEHPSNTKSAKPIIIDM